MDRSSSTRLRESAEVSELLRMWARGRTAALDDVVARVYPELRRLARRQLRRERPDHSLQPTALVNEAYLRLVQQRSGRADHRAQFYAAAAAIMRRILVDHARARGCGKRAGGVVRVEFDEGAVVPPERGPDVLALEEALLELERRDPRKAKVVELRYFGGLTVEEIGELLELSPATVKRDWAFARAWLYRSIKHRDTADTSSARGAADDAAVRPGAADRPRT